MHYVRHFLLQNLYVFPPLKVLNGPFLVTQFLDDKKSRSLPPGHKRPKKNRPVSAPIPDVDSPLLTRDGHVISTLMWRVNKVSVRLSRLQTELTTVQTELLHITRGLGKIIDYRGVDLYRTS